VGAHNPFDLAFAPYCGPWISLPIEMVQFTAQAMEIREPVCVNLSRPDTRNYGTTGLSLVLTVAKSTTDRYRGNFRKSLHDRCVASPDLHFTQSWGVDKEHT